MKTAILILAEGFEEVEAITPINYLNQAGIRVIVAAVGDKLGNITGMHGIKINIDILVRDFLKQKEQVDAIIIPGGTPGTQNIANSEETMDLIKEMASTGKLICAISDSPIIILAPLGLLIGKTYTCFPDKKNIVKDGKWTEERVSVDGNLITSCSTGSSGEFSIAIIKHLLSNAEGEEIARKVLINDR